MYDKTVRRRRAVLGLLVACSLILLTAYFGESGGGALHASSAARARCSARSRRAPAARSSRSATCSAGSATRSTPRARSRTCARERDACAREVADARAPRAPRTTGSASLSSSTGALGLDDYGPTTGRVIVQSPTVWYSTIRVNKGSDDGVRDGEPVINERGARRPRRPTSSAARRRSC